MVWYVWFEVYSIIYLGRNVVYFSTYNNQSFKTEIYIVRSRLCCFFYSDTSLRDDEHTWSIFSYNIKYVVNRGYRAITHKNYFNIVMEDKRNVWLYVICCLYVHYLEKKKTSSGFFYILLLAKKWTFNY